MKNSFWSPEKSIALSRAIVLLFAFGLCIVNVFGVPFTNFMIDALFSTNNGLAAGYLLLANLYLCSVPGYVLLYSLYQLLKNIAAEDVFVPANVAHLRSVSWCCIAAAILCGGTAVIWPSLGVVAVAAAFMALIVRVVKNVFDQAIQMKNELDFTI